MQVIGVAQFSVRWEFTNVFLYSFRISVDPWAKVEVQGTTCCTISETFTPDKIFIPHHIETVSTLLTSPQAPIEEVLSPWKTTSRQVQPRRQAPLNGPGKADNTLIVHKTPTQGFAQPVVEVSQLAFYDIFSDPAPYYVFWSKKWVAGPRLITLYKTGDFALQSIRMDVKLN